MYIRNRVSFLIKNITIYRYRYLTPMNDEIKLFIAEEIDKLRKELLDRIDKQAAHEQSQQSALALTTKQTMILVGEKIQTDVYNDVMREINTNIAPKVNQAMQWINYNMEDGAATVDSYRREVERQELGDALMITDGTKDNRVISAHVRTYYADSDDDA